jgi:hypothetical protein
MPCYTIAIVKRNCFVCFDSFSCHKDHVSSFIASPMQTALFLDEKLRDCCDASY